MTNGQTLLSIACGKITWHIVFYVALQENNEKPLLVSSIWNASTGGAVSYAPQP